jgi:hypothetical protein
MRVAPTTAAEALDEAAAAFAGWRTNLVADDDESLASAVGKVAGPSADATWRSFVLHIADELTHHTAEAADRRTSPRCSDGSVRDVDWNAPAREPEVRYRPMEIEPACRPVPVRLAG